VELAQLEAALATARVTSMAVGVLMATFKIGSDAAYDMLVVAGENTERTVPDIAQEVIDTGTLNWGRDMSGPRSSASARRAAHM
jgi:AmiR/NasT family two-component response regulator